MTKISPDLARTTPGHTKENKSAGGHKHPLDDQQETAPFFTVTTPGVLDLDGDEIKTIQPISVKSKLPRRGEWVIAFTECYRTVGCYRQGQWWDLINRTWLQGVTAWVTVKDASR